MKSFSYWYVIPVLLLLLTSASYLALSLGTGDSRPVAPLDDAYITYQYARQIAHGHPYHYNAGDPPTTGMTSPLFGFFLAACYGAGLTGELLVGVAIGLGTAWLALTGALTYRLVTLLTGEDRRHRLWAVVGAVLVIVTGSIAWGCFNGMETGLFTTLTLGALTAFLAGRTNLAAVWLGLAGLARTEGLILAALLWLLTFAKGLAAGGPRPWKRLPVLSAAVLAGLIPYLVNYALTGTPSAAGLRAKSWLNNVPFYPTDIARSIAGGYRDILVGRFLTGEGWFAPPGLLLLSVVGWAGLRGSDGRMKLLVTVPWFAVGTLSTATLITATWHMGRYQVPFVPVAIGLAVCGLASLWQKSGASWQRIGLGAVVLYLLVASGYSSLRHLEAYRLSVNTMVRQQLALADWMEENLPPNARVGVHDTGSLRYLSRRPTYDVIGLTTPKAATAWRHGSGSVFERMEHSRMRPDYFAIYPDVFSIPYLAATDLFAEELFRVEAPEYGVASAGPVQGVWRADWHRAASGDRMYQSDIRQLTEGLHLVDTLDVADLEDEAAHAVRWRQGSKQPGFPTEVWQLAYRVPPHQEALDGGRLLTGAIAFDASTEPGEDLWIVARLHAQQGGSVGVEIDERSVGIWDYPSIPGRWLETAFRVPGDQITHSRTRITLSVDTDNPDFRHYAPYHFWMLQGNAQRKAADAEHELDVSFGKGLTLLGFDEPRGPSRAGDVVEVNLYWQSKTPTDSDAKVFLHLYDTTGNLGPQSDGWAFHDTRPPYTWAPGEVIEDPRALSLPDSLPSGDYSLEVGLYEPDGSGRLAAYQNQARQPADRVTLTTIEVVE